MNRSILIFLTSTTILFGEDKFALPPEISSGIAHSEQSERLGDLAIKGVDKDVFEDYIKSNWRKIEENIEVLPQNIPPLGFRATSEKQSFNTSVSNFAAACECLPPSDYIEFLDGLLSLYEKKRISVHSISLNFLGRGKKHNFLAVNWEYPSVRALCQRALEVLREEKEALDVRDVVKSISKGELADNYMSDISDDGPHPETLPGIKLARPWGSLIKKYEQISGKKLPPDPDFPDSQVISANRIRQGDRHSGDHDSVLPGTWSVWKWGAVVSALCLLMLSIRKLFASRKTR